MPGASFRRGANMTLHTVRYTYRVYLLTNPCPRETLKGIFSPFCRVPANYRSCDPETEGSCTMLNYAKAGLAGLALLSSAEVSLPL